MLTAKHGDHEEPSDHNDSTSEEVADIEQYLKDNFKQFVIAAAKEDDKVLTGGQATSYAIITFSLALLKRAHYKYKVDGLFDFNNAASRGIKKNLETAMAALREVRVLSLRALAQSQGEEDMGGDA